MKMIQAVCDIYDNIVHLASLVCMFCFLLSFFLLQLYGNKMGSYICIGNSMICSDINWHKYHK